MVERNKEMPMSSTEALMQINKLLGELSADELMIVAQSAQLRAKRLKSGRNQDNTKKGS
jgi:hypothetical protein